VGAAVPRRREPSLVISPARTCGIAGGLPGRGLGHRLGDAGGGGQLRHAVELLRAGAATRPWRARPVRSSSRGSLGLAARPVTPAAGPGVLLPHTLAGSAQAWPTSAPARWPSRSMEVFALGYATHLAYACHQGRKMGAELRGRLQALGVLRASGQSTSTARSWCYLRRDGGGDRDVRRKVPPTCDRARGHLYLPGPHRGVWNRAA